MSRLQFTNPKQRGTTHRRPLPASPRRPLASETKTLRAPEGGTSRCGFSFVELIVVMLISGILLSIAAPRLSGALNQFRVTNAAKRIAADVNRAQLAAYNSSMAKSVTFSFSQNQIAIPAFAPLNGTTGTYVLNLNADPFRVTLLKVWGLTTNQTLTFNGYGVPNLGGSIVIACGSAQKTIQVDAVTGKAVIQ